MLRLTFDKQMRDDGWAGDFADWVGGVFGSDNTADKVRADLKTYKNNVARLQNAAKKGDRSIQTNIPERLWRKI